MSRIAEFLTKRKPRRHRAAKDIQYMASYLDGTDRKILDVIAEIGFKGACDVLERDVLDLKDVAKRLVNKARKRMESSLAGDFEAEEITHMVASQQRERALELVRQIRDPKILYYLGSFLDGDERVRVDAFAETLSLKRAAKKCGISRTHLGLSLPYYLLEAFVNMQSWVGQVPGWLNLGPIQVMRLKKVAEIEALQKQILLLSTQLKSAVEKERILLGK